MKSNRYGVCAETGAGVVQSWEGADEADDDTCLGRNRHSSTDGHSDRHIVHTGHLQTRCRRRTYEVDCTYYCNVDY